MKDQFNLKKFLAENKLTENTETKNVTVQNMVFKENGNSERVVGYDFVRGAYAVLSDTIDFYTVEELEEKFKLSQEDVNTLETMFDY